MIVVCGLMIIVTAGLLLSLTSKEFYYAMSSEKIELQGKVRTIAEWIEKDVRQAISWDIANNAPLPTYLKFRQVSDWDNVNHAITLSSDYFEYQYDAANKKIVRRQLDSAGVVIKTWEFGNVEKKDDPLYAPFYTRNNAGAVVAMNGDDLRTSRKVIVKISGAKLVRGNLTLSSVLDAEVKIRNE